MRLFEQISAWFSKPSGPSAGALRRALTGPRPHRAAKPPTRSAQRALSGYGNNPYDTYTWELHTREAGDGEREPTRESTARKRGAPGGDPTNPYDTGSFRGW